MIKHLRNAMLVAAAIFAFAPATMAQQAEVPVDGDVRIGKLDNGLTYYIRHNETPKGQADFYIAQKVGSILEEENQRGLAHFLEHMCFNGTENFPGSGIIDWLESIGVKFGYNLNAYTSVDQTVYNISNVPVARTSVQDSCLLILHDWADGLLLDPEEIDKERGVIHQEWRRSMVGQMRILENLLPVIYPENRYGERLPIGTIEVIDNFPHQAIRDYYETWYRPDQQGIIVVGDIDVDYIEGKIKEMFSPIKMPENVKERVYFPVEDTDGTIYAIGSDPEQTMAIVEMMFKTDAMPNEMKNSVEYLMYKYMLQMVENMLSQRLSDISMTPDASFAQAGADYGNFFLAKTKDAFSISMLPKGDEALTGFEAVYRELLRALRGGFTESEYERARAEYISALEKRYNGRDNQQNEYFVQEYVDNFVDNEPIPSIEQMYQLMSNLALSIPVDYINMILPDLVTEDNRVLLALIPDNGTFQKPTAEQFAEVIEKVDAEDIVEFVDNMKTEPLIPELPTPGKVVSVEDNAQWGCKVYTLSNGIKVYVKTTDFKKDEILFDAIAIGGTSTIGDDKANELSFLPIASMQSGLGEYTNTDLEKYLKGKQAQLSISFDDYNRELSGNSTVKDLPILMELIYMTFVDYQLYQDEYVAAQNMISSVLANQAANPQFIFSRELAKAIYDSEANQMITSEKILAADREVILNIIKGFLANAADYTFYFVGDVTEEQIVPLLEQYIATLPTNPAAVSTEYVANAAREIKPGSETTEVVTKMETPQTWVGILITGKMAYTPKDRMIASIVGQILSNRLLKKIREEMGAVYSISAGSTMLRQGETNVTIQIPFPMKPELKNEVLEEIHKIVYGMETDITPDELNPIKEYMVKTAIEDREQNEPWLNSMSATQLNGVDIFNSKVDVINSITVEDVENFMRDLLNQGNYRTVVLDPEATAEAAPAE